MTDDKTDATEIAESETDAPIARDQTEPRHEFRRDINVKNVIFDEAALSRLLELIEDLATEARVLQKKYEDKQNFDSDAHLESEIERCLRVSYVIMDGDGNSISGLDRFSAATGKLPREINSVFISSSEHFASMAGSRKPTNHINPFLDFKRPSLALDFRSLPSNPTENRSVINVCGLDESWVVSAHTRLNEFLTTLEINRPFIHGSGRYDIFLYLIFLPMVFWIAFRLDTSFPDAMVNMNNVLVFAIFVYGFLVTIIFARLLFQYARWLFPLVEYIGPNRKGPAFHRRVFALVFISLVGAVVYDVFSLIRSIL